MFEAAQGKYEGDVDSTQSDFGGIVLHAGEEACAHKISTYTLGCLTGHGS